MSGGTAIVQTERHAQITRMGKAMTPEQKTAIRNHCRFAFETAQPHFAHRIKYGASLVLTVNSGYE